MSNPRFILTLFLILPFALKAQVYNIRDFGAIPDGTTLNTTCIQQAIDRASEQGGGRVLVPAGQFLCGSVVLKSGIDLHLAEGAILLGSTNPEDYVTINRWKALVMADQARDVSISGSGTLDGQGAELALNIDSLFYIGQIDSSKYQLAERRPLAPLRPQVIEMVRCQDVHISGVRVKNAACWVQTYDLCEDLLIEDIRVESDAYWNNDGMDIIDCRRVIIRNCFGNSSDDGICLKSYAYAKDGSEYCEDILIKNCTVRSSASAVKVGTASYGGFRNVVIRDIRVYDTFRSAIAIEAVDGGFLENVLVENIHAVNTGNAIFIRRGKRHPRRDPGIMKDIVVRNVFVEVPFGIPDEHYKIRGPALPFFHNIFPSSITGVPGFPVENVHLENIEIRYPGRGNPAFAHLPLWRVDQVPEQIDHYPEFSMFGELPTWGFYVRHVEGLQMKNIRLSIREADYRPAMVLDDVTRASIDGMTIEGDSKAQPVYQHQSTEVIIQDVFSND